MTLTSLQISRRNQIIRDLSEFLFATEGKRFKPFFHSDKQILQYIREQDVKNSEINGYQCISIDDGATSESLLDFIDKRIEKNVLSTLLKEQLASESEIANLKEIKEIFRLQTQITREMCLNNKNSQWLCSDYEIVAAVMLQGKKLDDFNLDDVTIKRIQSEIDFLEGDNALRDLFANLKSKNTVTENSHIFFQSKDQLCKAFNAVFSPQMQNSKASLNNSEKDPISKEGIYSSKSTFAKNLQGMFK